jgi:hypothetical protein
MSLKTKRNLPLMLLLVGILSILTLIGSYPIFAY